MAERDLHRLLGEADAELALQRPDDPHRLALARCHKQLLDQPLLLLHRLNGSEVRCLVFAIIYTNIIH